MLQDTGLVKCRMLPVNPHRTDCMQDISGRKAESRRLHRSADGYGTDLFPCFEQLRASCLMNGKVCSAADYRFRICSIYYRIGFNFCYIISYNPKRHCFAPLSFVFVFVRQFQFIISSGNRTRKKIEKYFCM